MDVTNGWKAAQEDDQKNGSGAATTDVNVGSTPSDDISAYLGGGRQTGTTDAGTAISISAPNGAFSTTTGTASGITTPAAPETSSMDDLLQRSIPVQQLSGRHYPFGRTGSLNIRAYELTKGEIKQNGERKPCYFNADGIDCDFIYDPTHPLRAQ